MLGDQARKRFGTTKIEFPTYMKPDCGFQLSENQPT
jgi:hypothetical protein